MILSYIVYLKRNKEKADAINEIVITYTLKNGLIYTVAKDKRNDSVLYTNTIRKNDLGHSIKANQKIAITNAMRSLGIEKKKWNLLNQFMTYVPLDKSLSAIITWHEFKDKIRYDIRYTKDTWSGYDYANSYPELITKLKKLSEESIDNSIYETEFDDFLKW